MGYLERLAKSFNNDGWLYIPAYWEVYKNSGKNVISVFLGLLFLLIDGGIIIGLYKLANMTPPNCMYLLETPFDNMPWINVGTIGLAGLLIVFITSAIVEAICVPKEQRWYNNLRNLRRKKDE